MKILTIGNYIIFLEKVCYIVPKEDKKNYYLFIAFVDGSLTLTYSTKDQRDLSLKTIKEKLL